MADDFRVVFENIFGGFSQPKAEETREIEEELPDSVVISNSNLSDEEVYEAINKLSKLLRNRQILSPKDSIFVQKNGEIYEHQKDPLTLKKEREDINPILEQNELYSAMGLEINEGQNKTGLQSRSGLYRIDLLNNSLNLAADEQISATSKDKLEQAKETQDEEEILHVRSKEERLATINERISSRRANSKDLVTVKEDLVTTPKEDTRLSWGEIGSIAWNSAKKFVKGLVCDEEGKFSLARTATTAGVIVGCAVAAPLVAAGGAALLTSAGVAATTATILANGVVGTAMLAPIAISGGKKVLEGTQDYYNAETKEDAAEAIEHGWDGGIELVSIPVMGKMFKWGGKLLKTFKIKVSNDGGTQSTSVQSKPAESTPTSQSSAVERQSSTTFKKERGFVEQIRRDAEAPRIKNEHNAEQSCNGDLAKKIPTITKTQSKKTTNNSKILSTVQSLKSRCSSLLQSGITKVKTLMSFAKEGLKTYKKQIPDRYVKKEYIKAPDGSQLLKSETIHSINGKVKEKITYYSDGVISKHVFYENGKTKKVILYNSDGKPYIMRTYDERNLPTTKLLRDR